MEKKDYISPTILVRNVRLSHAVLSNPPQQNINPKYGAKTDIFDRDPGFVVGKDLQTIDVENNGIWGGID